jgi:nicotinate-nucleotide adenylyltransferase
MIEITESMLDDLRGHIASKMSPKRLRHTLAVEDMVARLCALFCPEETMKLRAAALLHDITKELDTEAQIALCQKFELPVSQADRLSPKTFHARTAAALIAAEYPTFADSTIVDAVRWHTTGRVGMTLTEQLLYLADYIDASRTFHSCVVLRRYFWGAAPEKMSMAPSVCHRLMVSPSRSTENSTADSGST